MSSSPIYLSKDGKVTGPYTLGQIEEFRQSGELYNYSWIWNGKSKSWAAIEEEIDSIEETATPPLPPTSMTPLPEGSGSHSFGGEKEGPSLKSMSTNSHFDLAAKSLHVLCHNGHTILNGSLSKISPEGCILESLLSVHSLTTFKVGTHVLLNLLNTLSGQSENVKAVILQAGRGQEFWDYQLKWDKLPKLLEKKKP